MNLSEFSTLWVCWLMPNRKLPDDALILSFALPEQDKIIEDRYSDRFLRGSEVSQGIRDKARKLYVQLIAELGATPCYREKTLRELMKLDDRECSSWWYHRVSFKDNTSEPTFDRIITVLTVVSVVEQLKIDNIVILGGAQEVGEALSSKYNVRRIKEKRRPSTLVLVLRGVASRVKSICNFYRSITASKRCLSLIQRNVEVGFVGFWDWSISYDKKTGVIEDRYYKSLPLELRKLGVNDIAWLLWLDPFSEPSSGGRALKDVVLPIKSRNDMIMLQSFLSIKEMLKYVCDFRMSYRYFLVRISIRFRKLFWKDGIDYFRLFSSDLLYMFFNADISHYRLVALATERAVRKFRPKVVLSFLEFYPFAKACYEGIRRSKEGIICCCIQHGTRSHESTFCAFDPKLEYLGAEDQCPIPNPDYCFAMGNLGRKLFHECGFPDEKILLTGSPRFEHIRLNANKRKKSEKDTVRLLFAASGIFDMEMHALDACVMVGKELDFVELIVRDHFFYRLRDYPPAKKLIDFVELSNKSLDDDIDRADILLFTSTTVAEEAFLHGKPVWQWVTPNANTSLFRDVPVIKKIYSADQLKRALYDFKESPDKYYPSDEDIKCVEKECFFRCDGKTSKRIAKEISTRFL